MSSRQYKTKNKNYNSDSKYIIRVGSCGGINGTLTLKNDQVDVCDVIVSKNNVGLSGCLLQSETGVLNYLEVDSEQIVNKFLSNYSSDYELKDNWLIGPLDKSFSQLLHKSVKERTTKVKNNIRSHLLSSYTKDSLYAETKEEAFMSLRDRFDVGCTEMEFDSIVKTTKTFTKLGEPVKAGMACIVLGVIPGSSFANIDSGKKNDSTECAILGALDTLHKVSLDC